MPDLVLNVDSLAFRDWQGVDIMQSIDCGSNQFNLDVKTGKPLAMTAGAPVTLDYAGQRVLTGYVDVTTDNYDDTRWQQKISGRSKMADIIDCSTEGVEFKAQRLDAIARQLLKPFGIDVQLKTAIDAFKGSHNIAASENIWSFLEKLASYAGVLLYSNNYGDLVIDRIGANRSRTILKLGHNILSAQRTHDVSQCFSQYIVCANADLQTWNGTSDLSARGVAHDRTLRYRPCVVQSDSASDIAACERQAVWQRNANFGRSQKITYTVQDWVDEQGQLWIPNTLVAVDDAISNIQKTQLISDVHYLLDDKGKRAELTIAPPEAYSVNKLDEEYGESGKWSQ